MIGNKDWYVTSRKNLVIMQSDDFTKPPYAIPYDFDLSGFVDAEYSKPEGCQNICLPVKGYTRNLLYRK